MRADNNIIGSRRRRTIATWLCLFALTAIGASERASALPSFAQQTGQPCATCHVGAFGPQLTPFGRQFKLGGYTLEAPDSHSIPLAAMLVASYTHTKADQPDNAGPHDGPNNLLGAGGIAVSRRARFRSHRRFRPDDVFRHRSPADPGQRRRALCAANEDRRQTGDLRCLGQQQSGRVGCLEHEIGMV